MIAAGYGFHEKKAVVVEISVGRSGNFTKFGFVWQDGLSFWAVFISILTIRRYYSF